MGLIPPVDSMPTPLHVTTSRFGSHLHCTAAAALSYSNAGSVRTWVAKLIEYVPVVLPFPYDVRRVFWMNGSTVTSTNVQFGIYDASGSQIYTTGSVVMSGASSVQYVTPSSPFTLAPGTYFFAWTCDSTTSRGNCHPGTAKSGAFAGLLEETPAVFGLPTTMTPVRWARAWGVKICGVTRTTTGF